jgi:transcriptional antiterminator NusG
MTDAAPDFQAAAADELPDTDVDAVLPVGDAEAEAELAAEPEAELDEDLDPRETALDTDLGAGETPLETGETALDGDTAGTDAEDVELDEDELGDDADRPSEPSPWLRPGQWFVVHTQSGYEKKVKSNLEARIQSMNVEDKIFEVVIPMEDVVEFKGGRKQVVQRKVFPGYLLVRCDMDDSSWYVIRNTPGVTGFVGQGRFGQKPTPLSRREVETFLSAKGDGVDTHRRSKPKLEYDVGESVRVKEGPFADFTGSVAEINFDHMKLKVLVNIFGRETLVEMDFSQVAKI